MTIENVMEVKFEVERLQNRIQAVIKRASKDKFTFNGCKETGALKRAALDTKMVLTKITK